MDRGQLARPLKCRSSGLPSSASTRTSFTSAIALILVLVLLGTGAASTRIISIGLGAGSLGYSVFWLWAGFRAPGLGSTGAAKESLSWLAMPASGAVVLATAAVAIVCLTALAGRRSPASSPR